MRLFVVLMAGLSLAACARGGAVPEPPSTSAVERIEYETGPCFGACPVYRLSVSSDGKGQFTGIRDTPVIGPASFSVTPEQYAAFRGVLAPYRPGSGDREIVPGKPGCAMAATDLPSVEVKWSGGGKPGQRLNFYYGCDMDANRAMADALGNAPELLPIVPLIGEVP